MQKNDFPLLFQNNRHLSTSSRISFKAAWINTPLGAMIAIADDKYLYFLEFADWRGLKKEIDKLKHETKCEITIGSNGPIKSITQELKEYFQGKLKKFKTPIRELGTPFQQQVWAELKKIPYAATRSYLDIAMLLGKPTAFRAVANANGKNRFAVMTPCHRVINHNGNLGGYGGGLTRKKWLIEHEEKV
jgi:AraC family transcriptional regulator of adaptative response/methylated-DNA-[protein]-cysteine methyltransferase